MSVCTGFRAPLSDQRESPSAPTPGLDAVQFKIRNITMPQKIEKNNKLASDNLPVIRTPEGDEIQITAGRKLQQIRVFARDPDISDAQFRALVCIVDRLNEGKEGTDESLWGCAYPSPEMLAKDIAKDERAARRIVKELRDGQRETRSKNGVRSLVPCKAVLNVENRKTSDGRDDFNLIRLRSWDAFAVRDRKRNVGGAPSIGGRSPVENEQQAGGSHLSDDRGHLSDLDRSPDKHERVTAPNSSQASTPKTRPTDTTQARAASGDRGPAACLEVSLNARTGAAMPEGIHSEGGVRDKPVQDDQAGINNKEAERHRKMGEDIWKRFEKRKIEHHNGFIELFVQLMQAGEIKSHAEIKHGLVCHLQDTERRYQKNPIEFLQQKVWRNYRFNPNNPYAGVNGKRVAAI